MADGLSEIANYHPDTVFMDLGLPDTEGIEGISQIVKAHPEILLIVLTGNLTEEMSLEALKLGAQDYITKNELRPNLLKRVLRFAKYRRKTEQELKAAKRRAEKADEAKSRFLANMSHEIRTPFNAVMGFSDILQMNLKGKNHLSKDKWIHYLDMIKSNGHHLLSILNDLLDLSKIEEGAVCLEYIPIDPTALLKNISSTTGEIAKKKKNKIQLQVSQEVPKLLYGDQHRLIQILLNLVTNANKFTENGTINIRAIPLQIDRLNNKAVIQFEVEDTGIGIPKDKQEIIFEYFRQADESTTRNFGGSGLGLAICKRLCQLMNGNIEVSSKEGEGSKFSFYVSLKLNRPYDKKNKKPPPSLKDKNLCEKQFSTVENGVTESANP